MSSYSVGFDIFAKDRASDVFDAVGKKAGDTGGRFDAFKDKAKVAGALAGAALVAFGKDSMGAYVEAEKSQRVLEDAYARFPALANVSIEALRSQAAALQNKTKFDGDDINAMQGSLAQYKLNGQQIQQLTPLILDYAEKTGKDLSTATEDVGKAMMGQGRSLKAIGIDFKDTGSAAGNFDQLMGGLRTQVGGFAEKEGASAEGKAEILKNKFGDLQESIGEKLMPAAEKLTDWLTKAVDFIDQNSTAIGGAVVVIGSIVAGIKAWSIAQAILNFALTANPIGLIVVAIGALVAGIIWVATQTTFFQDTWKAMTDGIGKAWRWLWNTIIAPVIRFILNGFATMTEGIARFLRALGNIPGFGWAKTAADKMDGAAKSARGMAKGITDIPDEHTTKLLADKKQAEANILSIKRALKQIPDEHVAVFIDTVKRATRGVSYGVQARASGGRYEGGAPLLTGEDGPELQFPDEGGYVMNAADTARLLASAGGGRPVAGSAGGEETFLGTVQLVLDGRVVQESLLRLKRTNGGTSLGLG